MSKFKFLIIGGVALLLTVSATTSIEARNTPRPIDRRNEYAHPWGGDESSAGGGVVEGTATSVQPDPKNPYQYVDGTKAGLVFGAVHFFWENVEVFFTSYTYGTRDYGKSTSDNNTTSAGSSSSNSLGFGGKGGQ